MIRVSYCLSSFRLVLLVLFFFSSSTPAWRESTPPYHSLLLFFPSPSPSPPPLPLLPCSFLLGEFRDWFNWPSSADCDIVDFVLSPLYQLSSRAVSVSSCFDVPPIRRLLAQTANPLLPDRRFLSIPRRRRLDSPDPAPAG